MTLDAMGGSVANVLKPPVEFKRTVGANTMVAPPTVPFRARLSLALVGAGRLCRPIVPAKTTDPDLSGRRCAE